MKLSVSTALRNPVRLALLWAISVVVSMAVAQTGVQVPTARVEVRAVGTGFELDGVVQPVKQSTISAQASGRIALLAVKAGERVKVSAFGHH